MLRNYLLNKGLAFTLKRVFFVLFLMLLASNVIAENIYFDFGFGGGYPTHIYQFTGDRYNINEIYDGRIGWELGVRIGVAPFADERIIIAWEYLLLRRSFSGSLLADYHQVLETANNHFWGLGTIFYLTPQFQAGVSAGVTLAIHSGNYTLHEISNDFRDTSDIGFGVNMSIARNINIFGNHNLLIGLRYFWARNSMLAYGEDNLRFTIDVSPVNVFVRYAFR